MIKSTKKPSTRRNLVGESEITVLLYTGKFMNVNEILSKLKKVKKTKNGWLACCPAHKDKTPSLKISIGDKGRILMYCHAGCTLKQICHALGITVKNLYPTSIEKHSLTIRELAQAKALPPEFLKSLGIHEDEKGVIIPYLDLNEKPGRTRRRWHVVAKEGSAWEGKGKILPYGLWRISEKDIVEGITFVEGESDSWTLWHCGFNALGIPGAQMVRVLEKEHVQGIETICVIQEPDEGGKAFVKSLQERLKKLDYKGAIHIVKMEDAGAKDPNELYQKLGKKEFIKAFGNMKEKAKTQGLKPESEPIIKSLSHLMTKTFTPTNWIIPGVLPEGLTILAGRPKMGKSAMALNIALAVAYGVKVFNKNEVDKGAVLFLALEDGERRLRERIDKLVGNMDDYPKTFDYATFLPGKETEKLKVIEDWLKSHPNAKLVVIDTLAKIRPVLRGGESIYDRDYQSVQGIKRLSELYGVSILLIHHTRKADATDVVDTVSGSLGLVGSVDGVLILRRERGKMDAVLSVTGRDIEEKEFALKFIFPFWELLGEAEDYRNSQEKQAVITILREANTSLTPKQVQEALKEKGDKRTLHSIQILLNKMSHKGEIKCTERGKYSI